MTNEWLGWFPIHVERRRRNFGTNESAALGRFGIEIICEKV